MVQLTAVEYSTLRLLAPCKINLHLRIMDKRADGFHSLESVVSLLAFGDTVSVSLPPGGEIRLGMEYAGPCAAFAGELNALPRGQNLAWKAAALFRETTGFVRGVSIGLVKRIPPGSGLGGGSSDAASVLAALNTLAGSPLSNKKLLSLASKLGSDVPFFLCGKESAWVSGRGERLEPFSPPFADFGVVLVFSSCSSPTARAFALLDESRAGSRRGLLAAAFRAFARPVPKSMILERGGRRKFLAALEEDPASWPFENDFLSLFSQWYHAPLQALSESGALFTGLSGSGSACFGIYPCRRDAEKAAAELSRQAYGVQTTFFLRSGD